MAVQKFSRQREAIKKYLSNTTAHPTAETIYENIRLSYPKISLGTVYRNLNLLVEQGQIVKISCGDGSDHFDGNTLPHYHFICKNCGSISDLDMPSIDHIQEIASTNFNGEITGHLTYFLGTCPKCLKKEQVPQRMA